MRGSLRWLVGSICVLAASCAWGQDGRIHFRGAVVAPTCATATVAPSAMTSRLHCGSPAQVRAGTAASYSQSVESLADPHPTGNRLLDYFKGYLAPAALAQAQLVARTYE